MGSQHLQGLAIEPSCQTLLLFLICALVVVCVAFLQWKQSSQLCAHQCPLDLKPTIHLTDNGKATSWQCLELCLCEQLNSGCRWYMPFWDVLPRELPPTAHFGQGLTPSPSWPGTHLTTVTLLLWQLPSSYSAATHSNHFVPSTPSYRVCGIPLLVDEGCPGQTAGAPKAGV